MFRDAKPGQKVWCVLNGWGVIQKINDGCSFPVRVYFERINREVGYTYDGKLYDDNERPCLFWDEIKFTPPPKSKRKVKKTIDGFISQHQLAPEYPFPLTFTRMKTDHTCISATLIYEIEE